jgi:outer membrane receptor for ferrienterochelin and colicin
MTKASHSLKVALMASAASFLLASAAAAQTTDPAAVPPPVAKSAGQKRVYAPADFARFAPKTAYDMLVQVPGFSIRGADQERGLGQASENVLINGQRIANKSGVAIDQLQRISASSVERIEIVDAASLGIAGLSGQVANVIV